MIPAISGHTVLERKEQPSGIEACMRKIVFEGLFMSLIVCILLVCFGLYCGKLMEQLLATMSDYMLRAEQSTKELELALDDAMNLAEESIAGHLAESAAGNISNQFFVVGRDGVVVVYLADKKTVYLETDIPLAGMSEDSRTRLEQGFGVLGEELLYSVLESLTS